MSEQEAIERLRKASARLSLVKLGEYALNVPSETKVLAVPVADLRALLDREERLSEALEEAQEEIQYLSEIQGQWDAWRRREGDDLQLHVDHGCICPRPNEKGGQRTIRPDCKYHATAARWPEYHAIPWNCPTFYDTCNCRETVRALRAALAATDD